MKVKTLTPKQKKILDFIKKFRERKGYSPSLREIARSFKKSVPTIHQFVLALTEKGFLEKENMVARAILPNSDEAEILLLGYIAAGEPIEPLENPEPIRVPASMISPSGQFYALRVKGDSMVEDGICDKDIVVVKHQLTAEPGESVVAITEKGATLKIFRKKYGKIFLEPRNKNLNNIYPKQLEIRGVLSGLIRNNPSGIMRRVGIDKGIIEKIKFRDTIEIPSTTHATFGLYRYPAKFIPHVVAYILKNYSKPGMKIFDPFAGYGTVGVVSRIYGCDYELWDINPLLKMLHSVSIMNPVKIDINNISEEILHSKEKFIPDWDRLGYWFPEEILPFLFKTWGYYHSLSDSNKKLILAIPLLKTTRYFSYDDTQRQKLSRSKKSQEKIKKLLGSNWETRFFQMFNHEVSKIIKGINEYQMLNPKNVEGIIRNVDTLTQNLIEKKDILITSPPYLQSQEYMRQAKLDLFWLNFPQKKIKELSKLEIPYREVIPIEIKSDTFYECRNQIRETHIRKIFDRYFWGILGCFSHLQEKISKYMFIFVGHSSARGNTIPLDEIFVEHLTNYGWIHEKTLSDTIVSRQLFSYKINPASKRKDKRTAVENLVILKRS
jgi:SOS regulatory protein LexA